MFLRSIPSYKDEPFLCQIDPCLFLHLFQTFRPGISSLIMLIGQRPFSFCKGHFHLKIFKSLGNSWKGTKAEGVPRPRQWQQKPLPLWHLWNSRPAVPNLPYSRSRRHVWQTFLILLHVWHTSVFLNRMRAPGHQRKMVKGRSQILHSLPNFSLVCGKKIKQDISHTSRQVKSKTDFKLNHIIWFYFYCYNWFVSILTMRMYGLSPRHVWQRIGKSWIKK